MIPKKLHAVWYGAPIPADVSHRVDGWRTLHPDFEVKVWGEGDSPLHLPYLQRALRLKLWANASNLMRLWVLQREGGIYLDTDVDIVRPLDCLLGDDCFLGFESEPDSKQLIVNNAVVGSVPHHPFIEECLGALLTEFDGAESAERSSPVLTTRLLLAHGLAEYGAQHLCAARVRIYGRETFYPYGYNEQPLAGGADLPPATLAVHRWHKSWQPPPVPRWERLGTRLLTAAFYGADRLTRANGTLERMVAAAQTRAAARRLRADLEIRSGLFKGVRLSAGERHDPRLLPKLLGTHQRSLQQVLAGWGARDYVCIYRLGSGCGVPVAGLATLFPRAQIVQLAARGRDRGADVPTSGTDNQSVATRDVRGVLAAERSLMIGDVEGVEDVLVADEKGELPEDLIIELGELACPARVEKLKRLLGPTHRIRIVREEGAPLRALEAVRSIQVGDAARFADESHGPEQTKWLVAEAMGDGL